MKRRLFCIAGLAPALLRAQGPWPTARPIRMLVGQPAGYSPDIASRQLAEALSAELKQTIVVENKPGGGSALMMRELRSAAPDGYTLGSVFWNQMTVAPSLIRQIDYNPAEDFAHVGIWSTGPQLLVAHPGSGIRSMADLVARARAARPPMNWASHGNGSPGHVFMSLLLDKAGLTMNHVPFPGNQTITATVSGDVPVAITGVFDGSALVRSGQLVALAVTGSRRLKLLPEVPTLTEAGHPGVEYGVWAGLIAPKGTPPELIERLNAALRAAAAQPALRDKREAAGSVVQVSSAAEMQQRVREEIPFWRDVVKRAGIQAN
ncbi:MAG: tripartite tricarboxylate transporter substrate binding protein [Rubrivivax sp.]|nr:tripartite tricarboxylate transporter substrate binding protein [Rubrivivax sp.]